MRTILVALLVVAACRPAPREEKVEAVPVPGTPATPPPAASVPDAAPVVSSVTPDSVRLAANGDIVLRGTGFAMAATNTVHVGPIVIAQVASATGTELRVSVPARYTTNAEAPPRPLFPGSYPVSVDVGGRRSNAVTLKVIQ